MSKRWVTTSDRLCYGCLVRPARMVDDRLPRNWNRTLSFFPDLRTAEDSTKLSLLLPFALTIAERQPRFTHRRLALTSAEVGRALLLPIILQASAFGNPGHFRSLPQTICRRQEQNGRFAILHVLIADAELRRSTPPGGQSRFI